MKTKLRRLLLKDHITPQTTTGYSPAELLFNQWLCSALTPDVSFQVRGKQVEPHRKTRLFQLGDAVLARNFGQGEQWVSGKITGILGSTNYTVLLDDGRIVHRHVNQLLSHNESIERYNDIEPEGNQPSAGSRCGSWCGSWSGG